MESSFNNIDEFKSMIELMTSPIYWCDATGIIHACNSNYAKVFGLDKEKVIGRRIFDLLADRDHSFKLERLHKQVIVSSNSFNIEEEYFYDGKRITFISQKSPLSFTDKNLEGILSVSLDVSIQKSQQENQTWILEDIIGKIPGHVWWKDKDLRFLGCNDQQAKVAGFSSREEIKGKTAYDAISKDQSEEERKKQANEIDQVDRRIIETGQGITVEEPLILPDGNQAVYLSRKEPLKDKLGNIIGLIGIAFDITDQKKRVELENSQVIMLEKNKTLQLFASAIAHELRTPLAIVKMSTAVLEDIVQEIIEGYELSRMENSPGSSIITEDQISNIKNLFSDTNQALQSATHFIDFILSMMKSSTINEQDLLEISIKECIEEIVAHYPYMSENEKHLINLDLKQEFKIKGIPSLVKHIFFNLFKNALHYIKAAGKGEIYIWTERKDNVNLVYFKDTGPGVKKENLEYMFTQFFSKREGGTGVGLAFCKQMMHELGGNIKCDSIEGEYTEFILEFPVI